MSENTPHINLLDETGFGKTVLMPGDPLRSKFIAENFLQNPVLVNNVRGVNGYTGYYDGVKVSVMASGMGMPSIAIYSYELFNNFDVQNIIRVGTAGAISPECGLRDVIAGISACTNSAYGEQFGLPGTVSPVCSYDLLAASKQEADKMNLPLKIGSLYSSDVFYNDKYVTTDWAKVGCLAVEMECAALYLNAMRAGKRALAICTVSDLCYPPFDALDAETRQEGFTRMMELALKTAAAAENLPHLEARK